MSFTSLVVPCYNEAARLDRDAFLRFLAAATAEFRIVFVDDGSTDATNSILRELVQSDPTHCTLLTLPTNSGKGEAVRLGMLAALLDAPQYVGYWDADLATPLDSVSELQRVLDENEEVEVVMGARVQLLGHAIERNTWRHYMGRVCATLVSIILDLPVYDTQCGAKLFRRSPRTGELFESPYTTRWLFDVEILARMLYLRRRSGVSLPPMRRAVFEYPLPRWRDVAGSKVSLRDITRTVPDLLRVWLRYFVAPRPSLSKAPALSAGEPVPPTSVLVGGRPHPLRPRVSAGAFWR